MVIKHLTKEILNGEVKGVRVHRYLRGITLFLDFMHLSYPNTFPNRNEYYEIATRISRKLSLDTSYVLNEQTTIQYKTQKHS